MGLDTALRQVPARSSPPQPLTTAQELTRDCAHLSIMLIRRCCGAAQDGCKARAADGARVRERRYDRRMGEPCEAASGQAEIEQVFTLKGRGLVLMLKDGFNGIIPGNGVVQSERGRSAYSGPEFIDSVGLQRSWLGVVAKASEAAEFFQPGDTVTFHELP